MKRILAVACVLLLLTGTWVVYRRFGPWFPPRPISVRSGGKGSPVIAGCPIFPPDNVWNTPVDSRPVDPRSDYFIAVVGSARALHADFGAPYRGRPRGIPYMEVDGSVTPSPVVFEYGDESDRVNYPIPPHPNVEGGDLNAENGDKHALMLDKTACKLYEIFQLGPSQGRVWPAGSGAVFDLKSNQLRPDGFTSADAAGLPILPGLVRYEEVEQGEIRHALRFSAPKTQKRHIWPARHDASSLTAAQYPPMGLRVRLKSSFDISRFHPAYQVILIALKRYGMILADNGSAWYLSGTPDERWNNHHLDRAFRQIHGSDFEAVDTRSMMADPGSGRAK
jgi:hypothetical protein